MSKSIFISYVYEDKHYCEQLRRWASEGKLGHNVTAIAERSDVRQGGSAAIKRHLGPLINGAAAVVCLIGQDTHNHDWVRYELAEATRLNKKVLLARIPNTTGAAPEGFRHLELVTLDPSSLRQRI